MYEAAIASVFLVWCLGVLVFAFAALSGAHRGDCYASQVARACRRAADLETWARASAPARIEVATCAALPAGNVSECEYAAQEGTYATAADRGYAGPLSTVRIHGEVLETSEARTRYASQVNAPRVRDWPRGLRVPVGLTLDYLNWNPRHVGSA